MKPSEAYPKTKITEINAVLGDMANDTEYAAALKEGSDYVAQKKYSDAKLAYQAASDIKPTESFPKDEIKKIDALILKTEKAKKLVEYKGYMAEAEVKFNKKQYVDSRALYQQALDVNPRAQYPKDRIVEIDKIISRLANKEQVDKGKKQKYTVYIQKADKAFAAKDYSNSKSNYKQALALYPTEAYPKSKIKELAKLMAPKSELMAPKSEIPDEIDFSNQAEKKKFLSEMAGKYGEGVHEENYESKSGKKVKRVIVVKGGIANEYRQVKQPWGATYFFKNGKTVSRGIFYNETKK